MPTVPNPQVIKTCHRETFQTLTQRQVRVVPQPPCSGQVRHRRQLDGNPSKTSHSISCNREACRNQENDQPYRSRPHANRKVDTGNGRHHPEVARRGFPAPSTALVLLYIPRFPSPTVLSLSHSSSTQSKDKKDHRLPLSTSIVPEHAR